MIQDPELGESSSERGEEKEPTIEKKTDLLFSSNPTVLPSTGKIGRKKGLLRSLAGGHLSAAL